MRAMNSLASAFLLGVLLLVQPAAQAQESAESASTILAEVGNKVITARDLIERVDLMPWPGKDRPGERDSAKIRALQSLVAEQILAMEATARGLGEDSTMRMHVRNLQKLLVRDALYRKEVKSRVNVTAQEIRDGLKRFAWQVRVLMIGFPARTGALDASAALRSGGDVDSVARHPAGPAVTIDTVTVRFGMLQRDQEDAVYALTRRVPSSGPIHVPRVGWVVLYLLGKETDPDFAGRTILERTQAVREKIRLRRELELADRYSASALAPWKAEAQPGAFDLMTRTFIALLADGSTGHQHGAPYRLSTVVDSAELRLSAHLKDLLIAIDGGGLNMEDILESFRVVDFSFPTLEQEDFRRRFNASLREVTAMELLSQEGYRYHLERTDDVEHGVDVWSNYWLAGELELELLKYVTVTDEEVRAYLIRHVDAIGRDYEVNVREILSDSLAEAVSIYERISRGADMRDLARRFSTRRDWALNDGESGYFPVADHPELGIRALDSDSGTLAAPVRLPEGYSVFSVLGKKTMPGDSVFSFPSLKETTRSELLAREMQKILNGFVATVANEYHVRLHYDRLVKLDVAPTNIVTKRLIGFGGSMLAAPNLYPLWRWVSDAKDVQQIFP